MSGDEVFFCIDLGRHRQPQEVLRLGFSNSKPKICPLWRLWVWKPSFSFFDLSYVHYVGVAEVSLEEVSFTEESNPT